MFVLDLTQQPSTRQLVFDPVEPVLEQPKPLLPSVRARGVPESRLTVDMIYVINIRCVI